jgi:hypothetical protein
MYRQKCLVSTELAMRLSIVLADPPEERLLSKGRVKSRRRWRTSVIVPPCNPLAIRAGAAFADHCGRKLELDSDNPRRFDCSIEHVVEMIRNCRETGDGCSLLIGAGCSVTAGIPTAAGFVELIGARYPVHHRQVDPKTYAKCMAALPSGPRRRLIEEKVDNARINWAHLAIAQLMRAGFVDRVLTTNFDPLVVRACALVGETPAVYDFATSQLLKPEHIPRKAVFHLHGQRTGFVLLNTDDEVGKHSERLGPLFKTGGGQGMDRRRVQWRKRPRVHASCRRIGIRVRPLLGGVQGQRAVSPCPRTASPAGEVGFLRRWVRRRWVLRGASPSPGCVSSRVRAPALLTPDRAAQAGRGIHADWERSGRRCARKTTAPDRRRRRSIRSE